MRPIRSLLWVAAGVAVALAAATWLPTDIPPEPPRLAVATGAVAVLGAASQRPVSELLAPWVLPAPPQRIAVSTPAPANATPSPVIDRNTLKYVGAVLTENQKRYFFKVNPTGQMLTLVPGEENKGWMLRSIQDQKFQIHGPGGEYEVVR